GGVLTAAGGRALASTIAVNVLQSGMFGLGANTDYQTIGSLNCPNNSAVVFPNGGTLNVAANGNNTLSGVVGDGVVILTASASSITQTLGNNSAFTGNLIINGGYIAATDDHAFGAAGGTATLNQVTWNGIRSTPANLHLTGTAVSFSDY